MLPVICLITLSGINVCTSVLESQLILHVAIKSANSTFTGLAVFDDGTSRANDLKSGSVLSKGSIISKRPLVFECIHVTCVLKHNTRMIRLYITSAVSKDLNNAN